MSDNDIFFFQTCLQYLIVWGLKLLASWELETFFSMLNASESDKVLWIGAELVQVGLICFFFLHFVFVHSVFCWLCWETALVLFVCAILLNFIRSPFADSCRCYKNEKSSSIHNRWLLYIRDYYYCFYLSVSSPFCVWISYNIAPSMAEVLTDPFSVSWNMCLVQGACYLKLNSCHLTPCI